jgi:hypothetical protein
MSGNHLFVIFVSPQNLSTPAADKCDAQPQPFLFKTGKALQQISHAPAKQLAQLNHPGPHARLDSAKWSLKPLGYLGLRQSFKVCQKKRPALLIRQFPQGLAHDFALLGFDSIICRIGDAVRHCAGCLLRRALARTKRAQAVYGATARQRDQPRKGTPARLIEIGSPPPDLKEDFLQNVFRLLLAM